MWCKWSGLLLSKRIFVNETLRLGRNIGSWSGKSYLHNPGSEPLIFSTVGDVIAEAAHKNPGRVAVRSVHEDLTLTYEQLMIQADALGYALRDLGLEKGDRLGVWSHNSAAWIVALLAAMRVGLIAVLLNPVYAKPELSFCIKKAGLKALFIGDQLERRDYYGTLQALIPNLHSAKEGSLNSNTYPMLKSIITSNREKLPGILHFDSLINEYKSRGINDVTKYSSQVTPEDGSIVHFTSGTTGDPKAALDSHFGVVNNIHFAGKRNLYHERENRICVQAPLFHALGSIITLTSGLKHGCTLVLPNHTYNVSANINALVTEKCTITNGTPTMYVDLLSEIRKNDIKVPSLRLALAAGAPCSPQLIKDMEKFLSIQLVKTLYGLSETTAVVFQSLPSDGVDLVSETVGYLHDNLEVKVVNEQGAVVPFGSPGELLVRGYNRMIGYWDEPEKTRKTIDQDGWLYTGDKFTISEDGYGRIVGRLKDIIIKGGENIAPKEIEDVLNTHPDIIESQVVGVADERLGEEVCAVVRLHENATFSEQDMKKHCDGQIAKFKLPKILKIIEEFPKTTSGKIQKFKIKEMIESGRL